MWCFKLYDTDNSGEIDRGEMKNIMEVLLTFPVHPPQSVYNMLEAVSARPTDDPTARAGRSWLTLLEFLPR